MSENFNSEKSCLMMYCVGGGNCVHSPKKSIGKKITLSRTETSCLKNNYLLCCCSGHALGTCLQISLTNMSREK